MGFMLKDYRESREGVIPLLDLDGAMPACSLQGMLNMDVEWIFYSNLRAS